MGMCVHTTHPCVRICAHFCTRYNIACVCVCVYFHHTLKRTRTPHTSSPAQALVLRAPASACMLVCVCVRAHVYALGRHVRENICIIVPYLCVQAMLDGAQTKPNATHARVAHMCVMCFVLRFVL
eukprot:GDKI01013515.1.p2 GENE.GDKI01013515.1~~GDKI01013515.1.p2  ORF type:complete len:125 (+),score=25.69 GDKI01013515.1:176-550(+)